MKPRGHREKKKSHPPRRRDFARPMRRATETRPERRPPPAPGRWVIGLHSVREALKVRPDAVAELWLKDGWESSHELRDLAEEGARPLSKPQSLLDKMGSGNQGAAARITADPTFSWDDLAAQESARVLLLDGIQDPHNLGACLRTAWLLGVSVLFISENRSSPLTPTAMKVASGGAEHVPVVADGNLLDTAKNLKDRGFWLFGLEGSASQSLWRTQFDQKVALVVGSEGSGIRTPLARLCDELLSIPLTTSDASLNASVAAAIGLAEVTRQHAQSPRKP